MLHINNIVSVEFGLQAAMLVITEECVIICIKVILFIFWICSWINNMSKASKWEKGLSMSHYSYFASTFEMSDL